MFERLGVQAFRLRFLIVIVWVVLAVLSVRFAPSIASSGAADQAAFLPSYTPSVLATEALEKAFPGSSASSSAVLTFSREGGLTDADRAYLEDVAAWTKSADAPDELRNAVISVDSATSRPELASMLRSADGVLELLTVNLSVGSAGGEADTIVTQLRDHLASAPAGLETHVTGAAGITTDYIRAIESGTDSTTLVTVILVVIILLLIYRAPLAALVPLLTIGAAFAVARGVLGVLAAAGWQVSSLLDTFLVVLVFGVGTDYAIFLISRYREEVRHEGWHEAVRDTVKRIGAVISASAATVIVGLAAMAFADFEMIRSTGPALGVAVFITLLAGLTLTPALLGIFGHYLFWPLHMRTVGDGEPDGFFARLATGVSHHPGVVTVVLTVVLAIPILYVPQAKTNFDTLAELPASSDARAGYDIVAAHLGKGRITQSTALIDTAGAGDMLTPASLARLRDTVLALDATPGVDTVTSLVTPNGDGVVPDGLRPSKQLGTIADELDAKDGGAAADTSALLDTEVTDGLTSALDYVSALGVAFPDVAGRSEYRAATRAVEDAQAVVENVREQSLLSTQLRTLAAMLTSTSALAGSGGDADTGLIARYLDELAAAYPEVRSLPAYADATAAAADLAKGPSLDAAVAASTALGSLATHFDGRPDATLAPESLAGTEAAREARRKAEETFAALPVAFRDLATVFAGRSDDLFVPVGIGGDRAADIEKAVDAFVSQDRSATRFYVTTTDDPYSIDAFATVRAAQDVLAARAPAFGPGTVSHLGGSTAQLADVQDVLSTDFMRVGIVTVIGILLVLIVLLRALVAPLYLVATVLLSYGSALGLSAFLFQEVLGQNGISFYLPLMVFVLLVSLGADYNIFLMSRVREESEGRPIREGIRIASGRTGAVITSAGLILAGTFGSMATAPLVVLFQVGVAVAIGVLIDTFLVRSILVPAITTLVGDRAWWPSGVRLGDRGIVPAPVADAEDGVLATSAATGRRSRRRLAVALVLAALVPVTFAGLVVWSQSQGGTASTPAAVVVLDEGATVSRADGTTASLALGTDLAAQLVAGTVTDAFRWESVDSAKAQDGLAAGTYGAVLTIPADFSRRVAAIRSDATGGQPAASLDLAVGPGEGAGAAEIAREVRAAITATAARDAAASYVEDVLLAVTAADRTIDTASADARSLADRTSALADDASGIRTVSGELVVGLDELANGATSAVDGVTRLVDGTSALASGTALVADGATAVAAGAKDASTGAAQVSSGADSLSAGLQTLNASTSSLPSQGAQLATGASDLATGATKAASGAGDLATGLGTLQTQTAGLPGQTQQLADGAAQLSTGTTKAAAGAADLATGLGTMQTQTTGLGPQTAALATGAAQLSSGTAQAASGAADLATGLATMQTQTTGLGAQAQALASGASTLATGAAGVSAGATQSAAGAASLAQGADALSGSVAGYTGAIAALSASCIAQGGGPVVCGQLAAIAGQGPALATGASDLATGAHGVADGTAQVATGAAGVSQGATDLATGTAAFAAGAPQLEAGIAASAAGAKALADALTALSAGASQLADGTARLAAGMPQLETGIAQAATGSKALADALSALAAGASELAQGTLKLAEGTPQLVSGIAQSADGASQLATGTAAVADGATQLATGTQQLADGMTPLAEGVASAASGASDLAGGAAQLAGGVSDLAAGSTKVASGAEKTASGAATLADGTASAVSSFGQLTDAMSRLVGGARVVESRSGLLADDGSAVSADAARAADGLGGADRPATPATDATRTAVAERAADPVVVQASASSGTTGSGIAPYVMALALWLGALVAFLVLPAGRRGRGRRWWMGPVGALVAAAVLGTVGAVLMIAGLRLGVGMDVARLPALIAVAALAAAAFAAIIQALVVAFGDRGWLAGLLFAGVQAAACASPYVVDSLPGPLAFLRPLLPVTWAADAFRACIDGTTAGLATGALLLAGSLAVALLVTLAVAWGSDRPPATAPAPA